jgi:hypothetical protein
MERVVNFHDAEDDNIYVETDDMIMYFMPTDTWDTVEAPDNIVHNPIAKATYLLHYTDHFQTMLGDN